MEEEEALLWNLPPETFQSKERLWGPLLCPGVESLPSLWQGGDVVQYRPFTTTICVTLGMKRMGWH